MADINLGDFGGNVVVPAFTASQAGSVLTVSAVSAGVLVAGQPYTGASVPTNSVITGQLTSTAPFGALGATGTYSVSTSATISSESMTGNNAVVNNHNDGFVTAPLTTAEAGVANIQVVNNNVSVNSIVQVEATGLGSNTTQGLVINEVTPGAGFFMVNVKNSSTTAALNGTVTLSFSIT
jgi:hypothetical protein